MAQIGNQNAAKGAMWRAAIERAVEAWPDAYEGGLNEKMRGVNAVAHAFVRKMMEDNDIAFFREYGDRMDGKAKQSMDVTATVHETALEMLR